MTNTKAIDPAIAKFPISHDVASSQTFIMAFLILVFSGFVATTQFATGNAIWGFGTVAIILVLVIACFFAALEKFRWRHSVAIGRDAVKAEVLRIFGQKIANDTAVWLMSGFEFTTKTGARIHVKAGTPISKPEIMTVAEVAV